MSTDSFWSKYHTYTYAGCYTDGNAANNSTQLRRLGCWQKYVSRIPLKYLQYTEALNVKGIQQPTSSIQQCDQGIDGVAAYLKCLWHVRGDWFDSFEAIMRKRCASDAPATPA